MTSQKEALATILEDSDAIPDEYRGLMGVAVESADDDMVGSLLGDALEAKRLLDSGDKEGARAIIEQYRASAEAVGLGPMFEQFLGGVTD